MKKRLFAAITAALFILMSLGAALPAMAKAVRPSDEYATPEGYNDLDYQKMVAFLEQTNENGVKVGEKWCRMLGMLDFSQIEYDPEDPETWAAGEYGVFWTEFDGVKYISSINASMLDAFGALDLSGLTELKKLDCSVTFIESLNVSGCTALKNLSFGFSGYFVEADLSGCTALEILNVSETNNLATLDLSDCVSLKTLNCSDQHSLTSLDLSNSPLLTTLKCGRCALTELLLPEENVIETIYCIDNALTELDLSGCGSLKSLNCKNNRLTELDVSECEQLKEIYCSGNMLKSLDLSNNPELPFDMISAEGDGWIGFDLRIVDDVYAECAVAAAEDGAEFLGWYNEEGEQISEEDVLSINNTAYTRVTARFTGWDAGVPGDADGDGSVDTTDALLVLRCALGISGNMTEMLANCDMDGNGTIDTTDALLILRKALGIG